MESLGRRLVLQHDLGGPLAAAAQVGQPDPLADAVLTQRHDQLVDAVHAVLPDVGDDVPDPQPGPAGGPSGGQRGDAGPAGTGPVGVFSVVYGTNSPTLYVLIVHPTLDSVATLRQRLWQDAEYLKAGAPFLDVAQSDPAFVRVESSLLHAFGQMPKLEVPAGAGARGARILELRRYESHSDKAAIRKIEMFNKGGEIPIFKRAGLNPVFFSESVIGDNQPSLTYMLSHTDMAARDAGWAKFNSDPDWKKLSADPYYAATVSSVTDIILRPAAFSQI